MTIDRVLDRGNDDLVTATHALTRQEKAVTESRNFRVSIFSWILKRFIGTCNSVRLKQAATQPLSAVLP